MWTGFMLSGFNKSSYSFSVSVAQLKEAALMTMSGVGHRNGRKVSNALAVGSFERYFSLESCLWPVAGMTYCLLEMPTLKAYITKEMGELDAAARETSEAYA